MNANLKVFIKCRTQEVWRLKQAQLVKKKTQTPNFNFPEFFNSIPNRNMYEVKCVWNPLINPPFILCLFRGLK